MRRKTQLDERAIKEMRNTRKVAGEKKNGAGSGGFGREGLLQEGKGKEVIQTSKHLMIRRCK